jgi:erythromycin esterase-like protein
LHRDGFVAQDEYFYAEQNARIAKNAEEYYRSMFTGRVPSWNLRDRHMVQTLRELVEHVRKQGKEPKAVLWEHNSHLGDARATDMTRRGEVNVGQLVREQYGEDAVLIGFTTYSGTVTAASDWGAPYERKTVRPALPGSFEWLFHSIDVPRFSLLLDNAQESLADLQRDQLERAIGVIYLPETERISHYFYARLMDQFNAVMHIDHTHALQPLERTELWERGEEGGEVPETYPSGL